jgi:hypothetical protein
MFKVKKILALIMAVLMIAGCCSSAMAKESLVEDLTEYPIIFVPGFATSNLYYYDENGEEQPIWGTDPIGQITGGSSGDRAKILASAAAEFIATGEADTLAKELNVGFKKIFAEFACNPDGQPVVPTHNFVNAPAETNYKYLIENYPDGEYQSEPAIAKALGEEIGLENIFVFHLDFRLGIVELAGQLREYIDDVIDYCNEGRSAKDKIDKVNLYGLSHGGQISGTYLTLYGHEGKVHNAALLMPALSGAALAYDVFGGGENFSDKVLLEFLEHGLVIEEEFDIIFEAIELGFITELFKELVKECLGHVRYWGSFWDFMPLSIYEEYKAKHLDPVESAKLIEQSDWVHYEIMSPDGDYYYSKGFKKAEEAGTRIYIIAGYDIQSVTGMMESTDAIVPVASATGATVAPFGQRFADGYTQKVDTGFYQVSPSMTIDASTSYLPERTWFIEKGYHGMAISDEYTISLLYKLLLNGGEAYDVHNLEAQGYTQFHTTTNPAHILFAEFDKSKEGYLSSADTELVVTNISYDSIVTISAVNVKGADFGFEFFPFILKPGQSKTLKIDGSVPAVSLKNIEVDITYLSNKVTPVNQRTFDFTIINGEKVNYDSNNPLCDADYPDAIDSAMDTTIFQKLGMTKVTSYIYDIIAQVMRFVTKYLPC